MTEVTLDKYDLRYIFENGHRLFLEKSGREFASYENFLCHCITTAFISYVASKNWIVKDGKIYEVASSKTKSKE